MDIKVTALDKSYHGVKILDQLSCIFYEKKITCIMGESGCGKTTLIRILMGVEKPDRGQIEGMQDKAISAVFQEDQLCKNLSVGANIRMVHSKDITKEEIIRHLSYVGLEDITRIPIRELSGGMSRRVAIVRAIMSDYQVIFLDEPLKGFDDKTRDLVLAYIKKMTKGKTVIMVTHDLEDTKELGGKILYLKKKEE
ncbi:MAG TPA: ATP-binding cassette domain-containing protein [Candidatus Merdenecus merdavium]|nr:ATP-binding cassette domain-containing protein [Candidatus Merdenecus merdavium]